MAVHAEIESIQSNAGDYAYAQYRERLAKRLPHAVGSHYEHFVEDHHPIDFQPGAEPFEVHPAAQGQRVFTDFGIHAAPQQPVVHDYEIRAPVLDQDVELGPENVAEEGGEKAVEKKKENWIQRNLCVAFVMFALVLAGVSAAVVMVPRLFENKDKE